MAGLYVIFGEADSVRLDAVADRMRFSNETAHKYQSNLSYVWLGHDNDKQYSPAQDPETGVQCIVGGRLCWSTLEWQKAERLPYMGGTANRLILERYLRNGQKAVTPYNGAATIIIWDPRDQSVHLWVDQFGYHPAFQFGENNERPMVFTTFPDAVVADPTLDVRSDFVSMAEFLRAWRVTPPNTYYENLKHIGPATHISYNLEDKRYTKNEYWQPFENGFYQNINDAADDLATAIRSAVKERTAVAEKSAIFISGGADSRVMLYAADDPSKVWGINLYEKPTHESATARALCERAGSTYIGFGRDNDYYPRLQAENVIWSGAMWSTEDNHYLGVHDLIEEIGADLVMTACTTDWIFKGYGLEKTYHKLLGRNLPIQKLINKRVNGFLPNYPRNSPPQYADEIDERMESWLQGTPIVLNTDRDHLLVEDRRVRPTCYTVSVSGQIMYRTYPFDTFLADSRVAECYSRLPAKWKINGEAWGLAAGRVCDKASDIADSNFGWSVNAGTASKLFQFTKGWVLRRLKNDKADGQSSDHPPSYASWPDIGWYANHSRTLQDFWGNTDEHDRILMTQLWGSDPWEESLEQWSHKPNELMRMLTLLQHWQS